MARNLFRGLLFSVRGRGRGRGRGRLGGWDSRLAGWPDGRLAVAGCRVCRRWPGGREAGWPGGRVVGWPGGRVGGRVSAIRLHTKQLVFSYISGNLAIHISANYTRRPVAKQQACAAKEEQVA